ncbi:hypothetical protein [Prosthecobacter sp.]|uniref:hypothetical protein n=1 Tax=Prosthecobacter sp. TaxID=1965333 RepID=UPI002AB9F23B|nr:hypothetical protein [Prosthecobacter sp.]MDZ4402873.1 hypothetical protein [Prosthecobacter sp.]
MIPLTGKVVMFCGTNLGSAKDCIEWAVHALCHGEDTPHLRILAGLTEPVSSFEVRDYAIKTLKELNISIPTGDQAVIAYARDLIQEIANDPTLIRNNLRLLCQLCMENDYLRSIYDFYLLRWAFDDLQQAEVQWYWDGADRCNIETIVLKRCSKWLDDHSSTILY